MKATIYTLFWMMTSMILNIEAASAQQSPQYIDLGLPSGTLWATCNIGANNPWEYGDYFAWGETTTKKSYSWAFYQYADGNFDKIIKYCNKSFYGNNGHTDKLKTLEKEDDAANANLGPDWCMHTIEQYRELMENCTSEWTYNFNNKGVAGRILKSKRNDSEIFFPASGFKGDDGNTTNIGAYGFYWSSSLNTENPGNAALLYFHSGYISSFSNSFRYYGQSVRPVRATK
jgi:hypothetical protein